MRRALLIPLLLVCVGGGRLVAASLTATWDPPVDGVTVGYIVNMSTASAPPTATDVGLVTQYTASGLLDGTTYCFTVQAYDAAGQISAPSNVACGATPAASPAPKPKPCHGKKCG